jgi:heme exporter protein CcmD
MSHWAFVAAAYAVTILAVAALLGWSLATMRSAEKRAEELKRER